jgi:CheY-like chemotaxis protein
VGRVFLPLTVNPGPDLDKLAEVDLRVKVGGEVFTVAAGVDIQDVDGVDGVEVPFDRQGAVGVDYARIKTSTKDCGDPLFCATIFPFPFVVCIPGRLFTNLVRLFMDGGIGIPPDKLDTIFEAFSQADSSTTRRFGGTGLGLTISRQLAELMGGRLWVESEEGTGSTFHLELPFKGAAASQQRDPNEQRQTATSVTSLTILVAEDNAINQQIVSLMLTRLGHRSITADNGQQAVEIWQQGDIDLILMDIQLPVLNGTEALHVIRSREQETDLQSVPIITLTADALKGTEERLLNQGFSGYLSKPLMLKELQEALEQIAATENQMTMQISGLLENKK